MKKWLAVILLCVSGIALSDQKISQMPIASDWTDSDIAPVVTGMPSNPVNNRITKANMFRTINSQGIVVTGTANITSLNVANVINVTNGITVTPGAGSVGYVSIGANGAGNIVINTPLTVSGGYSIYLPATQGTGNLQNDGLGNLSWVPGGSGDAILGSAQQTWTGGNLYTSTTTFGNATSTSLSNTAYVSIKSSGTAYPMVITSNGRPGNVLQGDVGALTLLNNTVGARAHSLLVLVDSATDAQEGAGILELVSHNPNHNDPQFWIRADDHNSAGNMRIDSYAPNFEIVNKSTDNLHGFGKWEPFAAAYQSARMQVGSSRCYDNSGFDNLAYWEPLSKGGGLFLLPFDATGCEAGSGFSASSTTVSINFFTLNSRTVGLKGPLNAAASWTFMLPSTFANGGQVLYQATSTGNRNWEFTVNGSSGTSLNFSSATTAPFWGTPTLTSLTKAQIGASVPGLVGVMYYCSDCTTLRVCVSTGTTVGSYSSPVSATTACN